MKVAILAGGRGTRMGENSHYLPKPMVDIGGQPLLSHILDYYSAFGHTEFVVALGHLSDRIREYYHPHGECRAENGRAVELVDTGIDTANGGRVKRLEPYLSGGTFMLTYGDGLSDVDLDELLAFHRSHGRLATVTGVRPTSRFGHLDIVDNQVVEFQEKPRQADVWINGAFFVLEPGIFDYIDDDHSSWERDSMRRLAADGQLMAYQHSGFWQCMDTVSEWDELRRLWDSGCAPWKTRGRAVTELESATPNIVNHSSRRKRVLVTGHDGYIGKVLVRELQDADIDVTGVDSGLYRDCLLNEDASDVPNLDLDVRDITVEQLDGYDAIVHLAGLSNDPLGELDPEMTYQINYEATINLAERAKAAGVTRFVQASTCSIYGASDDQWLTEASQFNPVTAYGLAKAQVEADLRLLADDRFSPTLLRFATAYGVSPRPRGDLVVNNLVGYAVSTGQVLLKSDGRAWRPLVHIEDISRAITAVIRAPRNVIHNDAFNVGGTNENYLVRDVAELVGQIVPRAKVTFADGVERDRRNYRVNFEKLVRALPDAAPKWTVRRGIEELATEFIDAGLTKQQLESPSLQRLAKIREMLDSGQLSAELRWIDRSERKTHQMAKAA